uniref:Band 7 domain-containing protein n=1 Tax=Chromera velia CCMP2878 TaxID=1169474 RepID=A0A0G4ID73_9ALVE|mmetsp:Transcript_17199/g.34869  ORF Transcript_17199/g.34869 Transcript_17199/m.34869 type:complete len:288 (+) Transcript_17199:178-1041(+)|eukprot:Cvel_13288.t1-p1 / transcript=Cvel_13288.t1 / gene=Cvel_13288 / organism=Chromera_velia_CCMP2878 / gene_product=Hypersensitive-induced response protein 3, putative / transcript_product=Hypersensitive-induced response protein 3, putative / location=Cvel_scaffold901:52910-59194(+) / protein_length=287 / sequence_SO=supercontig / SO=protein_coding / is_pseudo=false
MGCCVSIRQDQTAVVERCGKFTGVLGPGCHCLGAPCWCRVRGRVPMRLMQLNVPVETKTKDNVFVQLTIAVQFQVIRTNVEQAFYRLARPLEQIKAYVFDVVRTEVPKLNLDQVFLAKDEVADTVQQELQKSMDDFGYAIEKSLVIDISPDRKVTAAMNEIEASKRLRRANQEKAEMTKTVMVMRAEAEAEGQFLQGSGMAKQRRAIIEGLRESVKDFSKDIKSSDVNAKTILDMVVITQYFDTLRDLAHGQATSMTFFQHDEGPMGPIAEEIRNGVLQARAGGGRL